MKRRIFLILGSIFIVYLVLMRNQETPLELGNSANSQPKGALGLILASELLATYEVDGERDIILIGVDLSVSNLTADGTSAVDMIGSWAMEGQTIQFLSNRQNPAQLGPTIFELGSTEYTTMSVLDAVFLLFREHLYDWDPIWSPDGDALLWASLRDLNLELYTIELGAEFVIDHAQRLTSGRQRDWFHAWSPDGNRIAYASDADGNENIYVLDLASGMHTQLTDHPADDSRPMWTQDGNQILFVSERDKSFVEGSLDFYIMDANGSNQRLFPESLILDVGLVWSPDGKQVAYFSNRTGNWHIYVEMGEGRGSRQVTQGSGNYFFPAWRP